MKIRLEHLAPYLIHNLNVIINNKITVLRSIHCGECVETTPIIHGYKYCALEYVKPILRPLSDLFNGDYEDILDEFSEVSLEAFKIAFLSELRPLNAFDKINYTIATKLFENHFDVFNLCENGLAIDINTLNK